MSARRVSVEWLFGDIINHLKILKLGWVALARCMLYVLYLEMLWHACMAIKLLNSLTCNHLLYRNILLINYE
jgi:hypothetical protein